MGGFLPSAGGKLLGMGWGEGVSLHGHARGVRAAGGEQPTHEHSQGQEAELGSLHHLGGGGCSALAVVVGGRLVRWMCVL